MTTVSGERPSPVLIKQDLLGKQPLEATTPLDHQQHQLTAALKNFVRLGIVRSISQRFAEVPVDGEVLYRKGLHLEFSTGVTDAGIKSVGEVVGKTLPASFQPVTFEIYNWRNHLQDPA